MAFASASSPAQPAPAARLIDRQARRRRGWLIAAGLALLPALLLGSARVVGSSGSGYSVSVPVALQPYDAARPPIPGGNDFAAARALNPDLPDPTAIPVLAEVVGNALMATTPLSPAQIRMAAYAGPPAPRTVFRGATATDTARAHYCLTAALYYEAASESDDGMRGVAQVVLNRVRHPSFPGSVCGVVFQGSQRAGVCQFTFACDGAMARTPTRPNWQRASRIAALALAGAVFAPVGVATHYHTQAVWPSWGRSLAMTNIIGAHIFHRWRGRWGTPAAFNRGYAGREPVPGPYLSIASQLAARAGRNTTMMLSADGIAAGATMSADAAMLAAIAAARNVPIDTVGDMSATGGTAQPGFTAAPAAPPASRNAPVYADQRLNGSGSIRDEYRNSGSAIAR